MAPRGGRFLVFALNPSNLMAGKEKKKTEIIQYGKNQFHKIEEEVVQG